MALDELLLAEAGRQGAATLHEAQARQGDLPAAIRALIPGARIAASAFTVQTRPGHNLLLHRAVAAAPPGSVLVVATGGAEGHDWGYWGDILTRAAQHRRLTGLVIDGCVRDLDAIEAAGFPVFARGTAIRGTGKSGEGTIGGPVVLGHALIHAGDLIVGDRDGVVAVAADRVAEVMAAAKARTLKETAILSAIGEGRTTLELYGWS
jgi:4-hydroxy-4-methyl-2-oxoglutarate aldolase